MAALDFTAFLAELKDYYHDERTKNLVQEDNPFLGMIPKKTDWTGYNWELPIQYGNPQGLGGTLSTAQDNKRASSHERFSIPFKRMYVTADVDNALIDFSSNSKGSFLVDALKNELDGAFTTFGNESGMALFQDGSGVRGTMVAAPSTTTFTVTADEVVNFDKGMILRFGTNAAEATTNSEVEVESVNYFSNTITITGVPATGALTANDVVYRDGDHIANTKLTGLPKWLNDHDAGDPGTLFGVDRDQHPTRLGGMFYDASSGGADENIEDAIISASAVARKQSGAKMKLVIMSPTNVAALDRLLEAGSTGRSRWDKTKSADAEIGFRALMFHTAVGELPVVGDPNCPDDVAYILDPSTWSLRSSFRGWGAFLGRGRFDQGILSNATADSLEFRIGGYGEIGCSAPGRNMRVKLA